MPSTGRPNILVLIVDEQPWDAVAAEGNAAIRTPSIDRLATQGCRFSFCFTQHLDPVIARRALLTGRYPSRLWPDESAEGSMLLPRVLRGYGYRCAGIGSMQLASPQRDWRKPHADYGFDQLEVSDGFGREDAYGAYLRARNPEAIERISAAMAQGLGGSEYFSLPPDETCNAFTANRTLSLLQQQAKTGQPFFCVAGFRAFAHPLVMPQRYLAQYEAKELPLPSIAPFLRSEHSLTDEQLLELQRAYYATVSEIDHHVGVVLQELERLHLAQNTVVVYTAGRGLWADSLLTGSATWIPDVMARVPLIIRGPADVVHSEMHCPSLVELVDIAPTLLEVVGIARPPEMQGRSFGPVLAGASRDHRGTAITELSDRRAIRSKYFQYVVRRDGLEAVFDLSQSETQFVDMSGDLRYRGTIMEHRHQLIQRMVEISE